MADASAASSRKAGATLAPAAGSPARGEGAQVVTRLIPPGSMIVTPADARILYQVASIKNLRERHRVGNTRVYELLTDITVCAFTDAAAPGIPIRHRTASEKAGHWTTARIAQATGQSERTVRAHIENGTLPASKPGKAWIIAADDAETYIAGHRR